MSIEPSLTYRVMKAAETMIVDMQRFNTDASGMSIDDATGEYSINITKRPVGARAKRRAALQELSDLDQELGLTEGSK